VRAIPDRERVEQPLQTQHARQPATSAAHPFGPVVTPGPWLGAGVSGRWSPSTGRAGHVLMTEGHRTRLWRLIDEIAVALALER